MQVEKIQNVGSGISFTSLLFIVFLVLKLTKVIDWSWVWIFAPLWIPIALLFGIWIVFLIIMFVAWFINKL